MRDRIHALYVKMGLPADAAGWATEALDVLGVALLAVVSYFVTQRILIRIIHKLVAKTESDWDDRLVKARFFRRISQVVPALVIHALTPLMFTTEGLVEWTQRAAELYMLAAVLATANLLLTVSLEIYNTYDVARRFPIHVYIQGVKILLAAAAAIIAVSILTGQHPLILLSGLGAMTAILLLISRDSIQGLVAGVQLVSNDMVRVGDWIEMPQEGADGDVIAITLHTVKVQNWDKTISTIPTYKLVSESFKNWRGMEQARGRRIKRSIYIDISTVQFCDREMIDRLRQIELLRDYIDSKLEELSAHNDAASGAEKVPINGRQLTNLGLFRQYIVHYLRNHPKVNNGLTMIVRHLQPTEHGIPLQVYAFSSNTQWVPYEGIQSDIFDHLLACMPEFGLEAFQTPSGQDAIAALAPLGD